MMHPHSPTGSHISPMNPNWYGIFCAATAVLVFSASYAAGRRMTRRQQTMWAPVAMLLGIPGASFAIYYAHLVEVPAWYYELRSWRGTELLLVFTGAAAGLLTSGMGALLRMMALLCLVALVTVPFVKPFLAPLNEEALRDLSDGDVCLQSTYSTCGAASATTLLRHYGIPATEADLAKEAYSYQGGTEIWYLARALHRRGLKTTMRTDNGLPVFLQETPDPDVANMKFAPGLPAIVGVRFGGTGHFIAILSREGDRFHVGDPLRGSEVLVGKELRERYAFSGFSMSVRK